MAEAFADSAAVGGELPPPDVLGADALTELADGVWVLPDRDRTPHVPNVGIVVGSRRALVIESGIGIANGERVLAIARELAGKRPLFVTATHFHPEHGYGVQAFEGAATILYNEAQRDELREKQDFYVRKFSALSPRLELALRGVRYVAPDVVYSQRAELDLGGVTVRLEHAGPAHTRGDQTVFLPQARILWTGDLVEERFFAIMPDGDTDAPRWISVLERLERLRPAAVVPGHGAIGDGALIGAVKESLSFTAERTATLRGAGRSLEQTVTELSAQLLARHPDWGNREWAEPMVARFYESR